MRLPTIIELIDMSETTHQKHSKVDIDEAIFQPFPSEIIFQNFKPFETYQVIYQIENFDQLQSKVFGFSWFSFRSRFNSAITIMFPVL